MFIDDSGSVERGVAGGVTYTANALTEYDTGFAFQLGVGVDYQVTDAVIIQLDYRLLKSNDSGFSGGSAMGSTPKATTEIQVHLFRVGHTL